MNHSKIKELKARIERDTRELARLETDRSPEPPKGSVIKFMNADGEAAVAVNTGDWGWYIMTTTFPAPRTCVRDWDDLLEDMSIWTYHIVTGWKPAGSPGSDAQAPVMYWVETLNGSGGWEMSWHYPEGPHVLRVPAVFTDLVAADAYRVAAAKANPGFHYRVMYYPEDKS